MNYFDYQQNGVMGRVWSLFSGLSDITDEENESISSTNSPYTHTLEIVSAALNGSLATDDESIDSFNLRAYEGKCKSNDKNNQIKNVEKLLYIVDDVAGNEDRVQVGFGDISERKIASAEDQYERIDRESSFESNLLKLYDIRDRYISDRGIDPVRILSSSLKGIPEAISELKRLLGEDKELCELIVSLCEENVCTRLIDEPEFSF